MANFGFITDLRKYDDELHACFDVIFGEDALPTSLPCSTGTPPRAHCLAMGRPTIWVQSPV